MTPSQRRPAISQLAFGVFDHLDRGSVPLREFYRQRLEIAAAYDRTGFACYHLAEHHSTPLGMAPSPGIFLAALAEHTERLHFGPLVYCLPLYHPIRLAEEIAMLDQLSGGRFEPGVGKGISPLEAAAFGLDPTTTQSRYDEALAIVKQALANHRVTFHGAHFDFDDTTLEIAPVQTPLPMWYGISSPASAERCAREGFNAVSLSRSATVAEIAAQFRRHAAAAGRPELRMGLGRFVVVADDDATALAIARRCYPQWATNFHYLYHKHGRSPMQGERPKDFDGAVAAEMGIAGSPATVRAYFERELSATGVNYLMCQFAFGQMTLAETLRSVELFAGEIMPALRAGYSAATV